MLRKTLRQRVDLEALRSCSHYLLLVQNICLKLRSYGKIRMKSEQQRGVRDGPQNISWKTETQKILGLFSSSAHVQLPQNILFKKLY